MPSTTITVTGNAVADAEIRFTPSGVAAGSFTVASTERKYDKSTNEWVDGSTTFLKVNMWREMAEGAADAIRRGTKVVVTGKLIQRNFEHDGQKRQAFEIEAEDVGVSVRIKREKAAATSNAGWGSTATNDEAPF